VSRRVQATTIEHVSATTPVVTALHYNSLVTSPSDVRTRERVATFERMLEELRKTARAEEWPDLSSGYRTKSSACNATSSTT
jgi:hypothetical protein